MQVALKSKAGFIQLKLRKAALDGDTFFTFTQMLSFWLFT